MREQIAVKVQVVAIDRRDWTGPLASDLHPEERQVSKASYMTDKDKIAVFLMGVAIGILTGVFVTQMKGVPLEGIADSVPANPPR